VEQALWLCNEIEIAMQLLQSCYFCLMSSTLCFDFGNTRLKAAFFQEKKMKEMAVLESDGLDIVESLLKKFKPQKTILSSVVNHNPEIEIHLAEKTRFHKLNYLSRLPFTTPVGKPETIGADRLALSAAAAYFFPMQHNLVIGMGSCVTYNFINKSHEFLGGGISPGMEMRMKALNQFTAKLPVVKPDGNVPLVGYDTPTNILSGVVMGMAHEIDGFIDAYKQKFNNFNVHLTGGDLVYLAPHLKNQIFADPDLIFKGLYAISEVNNT
jgi:type III pantothenate kinase